MRTMPRLMKRWNCSLAIAAMVVLVTPGTADAECAAFFFGFCRFEPFCVRVDTNASSDGNLDDPSEELSEDDVTVSLTQSASSSSTATAQASTTATSATGRIHLESTSSVSGDSGPLGSSAGTSSIALLRIDDLIFTGPGATVETSLKLDMEGTLTASASRNNTHTQAAGQGSVQIRGNLCGEFGGAIITFSGTRTLTERHEGNDPDPVTDEIPSSGILATIPLSGGALLNTATFTVPTGEPLQLELWMTQSTVGYLLMGGGAGPDPSGNVAGSAYYGNTLSFPVSGGVFDLPPGYTANSVQGGITDNNDPPQPVPIPTLGGLGLLALTSLMAIAGRRVVAVGVREARS